MLGFFFPPCQTSFHNAWHFIWKYGNVLGMHWNPKTCKSAKKLFVDNVEVFKVQRSPCPLCIFIAALKSSFPSTFHASFGGETKCPHSYSVSGTAAADLRLLHLFRFFLKKKASWASWEEFIWQKPYASSFLSVAFQHSHVSCVVLCKISYSC